MVRLSDMPEVDAQHLREKVWPRLPQNAWVTPVPAEKRRVALITTAGIGKRDDAGFGFHTNDYRVIPDSVDVGDLVMTHNSVNFDRSAFQQDVNITFPIERFHELANDGVIESVATYHYSFMGATTEPMAFEPTARQVAKHLHADDVNCVFLTPI